MSHPASAAAAATPPLYRPLITTTTTPPRFQQRPPPPQPQPQPQLRPRPPPARQGAPPSSRNFALSSAGGAGGAGGKGSSRGGQFTPGTRTDLNAQRTEEQRNKLQKWGKSYKPAEETIRNDHSTHYVQSGERPQNHIRGAEVEARFAEYPKLASLLQKKHALLASPSHSIPPTYLATSTQSMSAILPQLHPHHRFDVILLSPPKETPYEELQQLDLSRLAATPGFVWLWVGSGVRGEGEGIGLERGRELLAAWGYRRSEDIVWLKTNKTDPEADLLLEFPPLFTPTIEHCLMGIRGTVRRSNDPWFVHCNVDTDVMVWEGDPTDPQLKPPELQSLIENFCLGTRRLHLYGSPHSLRRGWLTVGPDFSPLENADATAAGPIVRPVEGESVEWIPRSYEQESYSALWHQSRGPKSGVGADESADEERQTVATLLPFVEELDALRPKSPPPRNGQPSSGGLGRGRGAGLGITRSGVVNGSSTPSLAQGSGRGRGRGGGLQHQQPDLPFVPTQQPPFHPHHSQYNDQYGIAPFDYQQQQFFAMQQQALHLQMQQQAVFAQWVAMGGPQAQAMGMGMGMDSPMMGIGQGGAIGFGAGGFGGGPAMMGGGGAQPFLPAYPIGGPGVQYSRGRAGQMDDADEFGVGAGQGGGINGR